MGWTSYHAIYYKKGKIDRKAECDAYFMEGLNKGYYNVLKSSMVGSTYYAAVKSLKKYAGKDGNGERIIVDIPENEQKVFAVIFLTSTNSKSYYDFSYKDMDETVGPYKYDCPKGILDLLSPTDSEWAKEWRAKCREQLEKKNDPHSLSKLPEGSVIQVTLPFDTQRYSKGSIVRLTKEKWGKTCKWFTNNCYFTSKLMKSLEGHYEIIQIGGK